MSTLLLLLLLLDFIYSNLMRKRVNHLVGLGENLRLINKEIRKLTLFTVLALNVGYLVGWLVGEVCRGSESAALEMFKVDTISGSNVVEEADVQDTLHSKLVAFILLVLQFLNYYYTTSYMQ